VNATSEALVQTNKALVEMNNVVQESIKFTCVSYAFAEIMRDTLQIMIAKGFKNTDGRLVKLNDNGREAAELVLQETESFARRQREQEAQLTNLKSDITQNAENISKNAEKIGKNVSKINKNKNNIGINATNIEQLQNLLQENIDRIENLEKFSNKKLIIVLFILTFLSLSIGIISLVSL
jgi:predicted RNase H-like nuclease (RuvC/YqgF family)